MTDAELKIALAMISTEFKVRLEAAELCSSDRVVFSLSEAEAIMIQAIRSTQKVSDLFKEIDVLRDRIAILERHNEETRYPLITKERIRL